MTEYTYAEHRFRFAAWAAGNAATRQISLDPARKFLRIKENENVAFPMAYRMLKEADLYGIAEKGAGCLPDPNAFDAKHRAWCKKVRKEAERLGLGNADPKKDWKHGRSAKLINVFVKALMPLTIPDGEKAKWHAVHPPIDGEVLKGMKNAGIGDQDFWKSLPGSASHGAFNQFEYEDYQNVINLIREDLRKCDEKDPLPLWKNERFFKP